MHLHPEEHFRASDTVRDMVIGMADGLTVPFALAAGVSSAVGGMVSGSDLVVTAGLAEVAAGSIAMGLGGYLAARGERDHYLREQAREEDEIVNRTEHERGEIIEIMAEYGISEAECQPILKALERNPVAWRDFMMRFELGLEEPDANRARNSALTIAGAYIGGGLIPLAPYMMTTDVNRALIWSALITLIALAAFGWVKGRFTGMPPVKSALQTFVIGGLAAAVAFFVARAFS
jgi:VIT1/CCC1 family predicted Fe2+/Mn2+ transporter